MSVEKSLEGGVADPQLHRCPTPGHFSRGKALQNSSKTTGEATTVRYPGPANPLALSPSPIHPGSHSLPYHLQLELCHRRQKVQQQCSHSRPCVELLSHALESDPQQLPRSQRVVHVLDSPVVISLMGAVAVMASSPMVAGKVAAMRASLCLSLSCLYASTAGVPTPPSPSYPLGPA